MLDLHERRILLAYVPPPVLQLNIRLVAEFVAAVNSDVGPLWSVASKPVDLLKVQKMITYSTKM